MILIVSKNKDFSSIVAEQVRQELDLACREEEAIENTKELLNKVMLVVTDGPVPKLPLPVISLEGKLPVRLAELLAEIEMALRKGEDNDMTIGRDFSVSRRQKQLVHASGKTADLTDKEMQLLQGIMDAGARGISKDQLLKAVWGNAEMDTHTLETHIYRLRAKFRELGDDQIIIASDGGYALRLRA